MNRYLQEYFPQISFVRNLDESIEIGIKNLKIKSTPEETKEFVIAPRSYQNTLHKQRLGIKSRILKELQDQISNDQPLIKITQNQNENLQQMQTRKQNEVVQLQHNRINKIHGGPLKQRIRKMMESQILNKSYKETQLNINQNFLAQKGLTKNLNKIIEKQSMKIKLFKNMKLVEESKRNQRIQQKSFLNDLRNINFGALTISQKVQIHRAQNSKPLRHMISNGKIVRNQKNLRLNRSHLWRYQIPILKRNDEQFKTQLAQSNSKLPSKDLMAKINKQYPSMPIIQEDINGEDSYFKEEEEIK